MSVYVRELAHGLGRQGHRVDIFTYVPGPCGHLDLYPNVRLVHLGDNDAAGLSKAQLPAHLETVFERIERYRLDQDVIYDVIHSHYWLSAVVGALARVCWGCPHLTMFHTLGAVKNSVGTDEHESMVRISHERWLAKVADGIVVPTSGERQNLLCHYHPRSEKIHTIGCGVNLELFQPMDRWAARRKLGIASNALTALYVGRFAPVKGIDTLLGAVARLKQRLPELHLVIVGGDGPTAESTRTLNDLARNRQISEHVTFTGRIDQEMLPAYLSAADFLALPSHYESFGLVLLEALACGTPVVATPVGAAPDIIQEGINGILAPCPDEVAIARAITRMANMIAARGSDSATIRATVKTLGWQHVADKIMQTYAMLLEAHPQNDCAGRQGPHTPIPLSKGG